MLEARAKSDRLEWELEGKLPPNSSFFSVIFLHGFVATKKTTTTRCHLLLWFCCSEERNGSYYRRLIF
jgi:hypothetical protein